MTRQDYSLPTKKQQVEVTIKEDPQPESHKIFTCLTCLFCNPICGYVGLLFSILSEYSYKQGRVEDAFKYGHKAEKWALFALATGILVMIIICFILMIVENTQPAH